MIEYQLTHPIVLKSDKGETVQEISVIKFPEFPSASLIMDLPVGDFSKPVATAHVVSLACSIPIQVINRKMHALDLLCLGPLVRDFLGLGGIPESIDSPTPTRSSET